MNETTIAISVEDDAWTQAVPDADALIERMALAALEQADCDLGDGPVEISVVLADDATVQGLNRDWRGKDKPTNVLSFAALDDEDAPLAEGAPLLLGDVILAFETCQDEAAGLGKPLSEHLCHLVVHGVLHLLGYDHEDDETEAEEMERLETAILAGFGIADPYAADDDSAGAAAKDIAAPAGTAETDIAEGGR
ncbi:MAG: rRNA maturation RNase YbeY [Bacteroidales bacterium]